MAKLLVLASCTSALLQQPARRVSLTPRMGVVKPCVEINQSIEPTRSRGQRRVEWNRHAIAQTQLREHGVTTQVKPGDFKNGLTIERDGGVWKVLNFQQTKTARQAAMVRTKLKN